MNQRDAVIVMEEIQKKSTKLHIAWFISLFASSFKKKHPFGGTNTAYVQILIHSPKTNEPYSILVVWEDEPYSILFPCKIWTTKELFPLSTHDHCASMRQKPPSPSTTLSLLLGFGWSKIASKLKTNINIHLYFCWETSLMACFLVLKVKSEFGVYLFRFYYSVVLVDVCFFLFAVTQCHYLKERTVGRKVFNCNSSPYRLVQQRSIEVLKQHSLWVEYQVCVQHLLKPVTSLLVWLSLAGVEWLTD